MSLIGVSRAFHVDLTPYLTEYGLQLYKKLQKASIAEVLGAVPRPDLGAAREAAVPDAREHPGLRQVVNQLIMGSRGTPDRSRCSSARAPAANSKGRRATSPASARATA